jgi:hypothetical protein
LLLRLQKVDNPLTREKRRTIVNISKTLAIAGLLAGMMIAPSLIARADAHDTGHGKSKHHYCYDKHGRWRSHPHCPAPQPSHSHRYDRPRPAPYSHYPHRHDSRYGYQRRPQVIYVRKDGPYHHHDRYGKPVATDTRNRRDVARTDVRQSRDQLREARTELKKDRAELRRDIRNHAGKEEIRSDRQEIRADRQQLKSARQDLRADRRELSRR